VWLCAGGRGPVVVGVVVCGGRGPGVVGVVVEWSLNIVIHNSILNVAVRLCLLSDNGV